MKLKYLLPGTALAALGAMLFLAPAVFVDFGAAIGLGSPQAQNTSYLVHVEPANYSYVEYKLGASDTLTATVASGQQTVDFFLMDGTNFTSWARTGEPSEVFPQSSLNVRNYTFTVSGSGTPRNYFMVFISRSMSSPTDLLVRLSLHSGGTGSNSLTFSAVLALVGGLSLVTFGARPARKAEAAGASRPDEEVVKRPGNGAWSPTLAVPACKYCGSTLAGRSFCSSCGKSQG